MNSTRAVANQAELAACKGYMEPQNQRQQNLAYEQNGHPVVQSNRGKRTAPSKNMTMIEKIPKMCNT